MLATHIAQTSQFFQSFKPDADSVLPTELDLAQSAKSMRKLALFGMREQPIDFEWPKKADIDSFPTD